MQINNVSSTYDLPDRHGIRAIKKPGILAPGNEPEIHTKTHTFSYSSMFIRRSAFGTKGARHGLASSLRRTVCPSTILQNCKFLWLWNLVLLWTISGGSSFTQGSELELYSSQPYIGLCAVADDAFYRRASSRGSVQYNSVFYSKYTLPLQNK